MQIIYFALNPENHINPRKYGYDSLFPEKQTNNHRLLEEIEEFLGKKRGIMSLPTTLAGSSCNHIDTWFKRTFYSYYELDIISIKRQSQLRQLEQLWVLISQINEQNAIGDKKLIPKFILKPQDK